MGERHDISTEPIEANSEMNKIKYILCLFMVGFHFSTYCQQKTDSVNVLDSSLNKLTPKEWRKEQDSFAKNLAPIPNKSIVYFVRISLFGMAIPLKLDCDSFEVGWIHSKTYLFTIVNPGEHIFKASSENEFTLKVNLEPEKIYYFEQEAKMGFAYARTNLKMLSTEEGKKYLLKCTISKQNRYPLFPKSKDDEKDTGKDE